tara:strand:+ start:1831 stop:2286 length:456 start_codon:yes stop_codon:yes gene_type:complete
MTTATLEHHRVETDLINQLKSEYLEETYKQDTLLIDDIEFDNGVLTTTLNVANFCPDTKGKFHLSATTAFRIVQQLGVIIVQLNHGIKEKTEEIWMSSCNLKFNQPIVNLQIPIVVSIKSSTVQPSVRHDLVEASFSNGAFIIEANSYMPL